VAFSIDEPDGSFGWEFQLPPSRSTSGGEDEVVSIMFSKEAVSVSMTPPVARWIGEGMPGLDRSSGFIKVSRSGIGPPRARFMGELVIEAIERVIERATEIEAQD
jgi:hypothetical protein